MATYRYTAQGPDGRTLHGQLDAASSDEARRLLAAQGLSVLELAAAESPAQPPPLSADEAGQLAAHVAQLTGVSLPLAAGLRAAAEESENRRLASVCSWLAQQIDLGRRLEDVLTSTPDLLPRHVAGLLAAAIRTGQLTTALAELVEHQRAADDLRRTFRTAVAYPLVVGGLAAGILLFIVVYLGGQCEQLLVDFKLRLPLITQLFFWYRDLGIWLLLGLAGLLLAAGLVLRARLGPAGWQRFLATAPLVGPFWHWSGVAEWSGLVSLLVRAQVPLLDALRLAADGVSNAHLGQLSLAVAGGVARGRSLSQMLASLPQFPAILLPLVRWGESAGTLDDALATAREMLEERLRLRCLLLLQMGLPAVLFVLIGCGVLFVVGGTLLPLITLLQGLS